MSPTFTAAAPDHLGAPAAVQEPASEDRQEHPGFVTFCVGVREYATSLTHVREVVRLVGLTDLDGMQPPLAGVLDLRGACLPVLDLRHDRRPDAGDVLVVDAPDGSLVGVAVDRVRAVVDAADLPQSAGAGGLPPYVLGVLRGPSGLVFRVDLHAMAQSPR